MKSGAKSMSGLRTRFWGPLVLAHFPQAPKTVPFPGPNFGRRGTATTLTLELAFGVAKSGRGSKISARCSPINPDVASSSICSTAAKKQVQACCMYRLILTRCSNCGGPLCTTTFSKGLFGLVNEPAQPSKIEGHLRRDDFNRSCTVLQLLSIADASTMTGSSRPLLSGHCFRHYLVLYRPKEGKGQGAAGWSATLQDFRQNTSFASKGIPRHGY